MYLPKEIEQCVVNMQCKKDKEGKSKATVFEFYDDNKTYYLKVEKRNEEVVREHELYQWLKYKLPVPKVIYKHMEGDTQYLLLDKAEGIMLESNYYRNNPELLVKLAAEGIKLLQGIDISHCPFDSTIEYKLRCSKEWI